MGFIKRATKRTTGAMLAAVLALCLFHPAGVSAAQTITITRTAGYNAVQGDKAVYFEVSTTASTSDPYDLILTASDSDITVRTANFTNQTMDGVYGFSLDIAKKASVGDHTLTVKAVKTGDATTVYATRTFSIDVVKGEDSFSSTAAAAFDVDYAITGGSSIIAGQSNTIRFELFNRGNTVIKNARVALSLPEGITIQSGAATINAGYLAVGKTYTMEFTIVADSSIATKSYPFTLKIEGLNYSNSQVSLDEIVYVPVVGTGGSENLDLEIVGATAPQSVSTGHDFTLTFGIKNKSAYDASNIKAVVELPDGVVNLTKNVFLINTIPAGATQTFTVTLNAQKGGNYMLFKISAGSATDETNSVSQYAGTMVNGTGAGSTNPQLMVTAYSYGGAPILAGSGFMLSLTLTNTSSTTALQNIKVTVNSEDGAFLPVGTSNSFYVPSVSAGTHVTKALHMEAMKDAEQKTSTLTIAMSYEDTNGGTHSSSDVISVPVVQETRLVVDDIVDPGYFTSDQFCSITVNYYNMGKTQLNNLRIVAEGDFQVDGTPSSYMGNMASGKSDYYSINFYPNGSGPLTGKVIFTYEDAAGESQRFEKVFTVNIGEPMEPMDPEMPIDEPESGGLGIWKWVIIGAVLLGGGIGVKKFLSHRKLKKDEEFDLDE